MSAQVQLPVIMMGIITEDALALARSKQVNKAGWGARFRAVQEKLKAKKK